MSLPCVTYMGTEVEAETQQKREKAEGRIMYIAELDIAENNIAEICRNVNSISKTIWHRVCRMIW